MKRTSLFFLLLLFIVAIAGSASAQTCIQGRNDWLPFLGNSNPDPMLNNPGVTIYANQLGQQSTALQSAVTGGADTWNSTCPRSSGSGQRSFSSIPSFSVNWGGARPGGAEADRNSMIINFVDAAAPMNLRPDGSVESIEPAKWGDHNVITAYRRCPAHPSAIVPELGCTGGANDMIDWSSSYAQLVMAHEIGHALGLDHDRATNGAGNACPMSLMNAKPTAGAGLSTDYCDFVNRANNDAHRCNTEQPGAGETNPCEVAFHRGERPGDPAGQGNGEGFCDWAPDFCDNGPQSWAGGAPTCNYFCVSYLNESSCDWGCYAPAVARVQISSESSTSQNDHGAPVVALDQPAENVTLSGVVTLSGYAHEFFHVPHLMILFDGHMVPLTDVRTGLSRPGVIWHPQSNQSSGFSMKVDTRHLANGPHTLQVIATDIYGFPTTLERQIVTSNACLDFTAPTLNVNVPSAPTGVVTVTANTTDDVGVTKVDFLIGGVLQLTDTTAPFTYQWDTTGYAAGEYWVEAWSYDACGNKTYDKKIVNVPAQASSSQFISMGSVPGAMKSGETATITATFKNIGSAAWTAANIDQLGSVNPDNNTRWGMSRVYLAAGDSVAPGAQKTFTWTITAPSTVGTFPFQWRMVKDANGWFGDATPVKSIAVTRPPGPPTARNDRAKTKRDTPVTINVLANDRDPDGQAINLTAAPITTAPRNGTVVRLSNTSVKYTPNALFAGNDVFEYEIVDAAGNRDRAWVAVHVGRTKSLPVAVDDTASTESNQSKTINVLTNDYSPDGDVVSLTASPVIQNPAHGVATRVSDTSLSYVPDHDFTGTDTFAYEISDSEWGTAAAFVTITVTDANHQPVAVNDAAATGVGAAITIDVVANDTDPDGDPLVLIASPIVVAPLHGSAQRVSPSAIVYTPANGYSGTDSFQYEIGDGHGRRARGTVTITVSDTNHPPEAFDDTAVTSAGVAVTTNVVANDSDIDGDHVGLILSPIITAPAHGTAVKISASSITYTPAAGFSGTDRFQYEIGDYSSGRSRAWVDVTIGPGVPNRNPIAVDDVYTTHIGQTVDMTVTSNDSDPDGDTVGLINIPVIVAPAHGTVTKLNGTTLRYVPAAGFAGADTLQYEIGDGHGKRARAWVKITVRDPNSRPVAIDDVASTRPGQAVTTHVTANDYDPDGDPIVVVSNNPIPTPPAHGTATKIDAGSIKYVPNGGFSGSDRYQYEIGDGRGGRHRAWVNVTVTLSSIVMASVTSVPPTADNDLTEAASDTAVPVLVLTNDYAIDGRLVVLSAAPVITQPLFGSIQRTSNTTLTYTPGAGFRGNDRFEYEVVDSDGTTTRAWVTVQIPGENRPPVAINDDVAVPMDNNVTVSPLVNDSDPDGDVLALTLRAITAAPLHGTIRRGSDLQLVYSPMRGYSGDDSFRYEISDGRGGTAEAFVTMHVTGKLPPVAQDDSLTADSGVPVSLNVLANDSDPDGDPLRVTSSQPPAHGSVVWNDDGTATYVSHPGYGGVDTFPYTISDGAGLTSQAQVSITVVLPNRAPIVNADSTDTNTRTAVLIGVLANDWDLDYPTKLKVTAVTAPAHGTATINWGGESVTYTPASDFAGKDAFNYTVTDGIVSVSAAVTVNVLNQGPQPHSETLAAPEDTWVGYSAWNVLANDVDPDGDELHITSIEQPQHGTFQISSDKTQFSYKGNENWFGLDSFYYTVSDPFGQQVRVLAQISVSSINDSPIANNDSFSVYKNQVLTITQAQIVANDTDVEGHTIGVYSVGPATNGATAKLADGSIEYRPYGEFVGTDSFEYIADDSAGGAYATARINVTVRQDTAPVPSFTVSCVDLVCSFNASASTDDRGIVMYQWLLGNNSAASGKTFTYTYGTTGFYTVRLTVQDEIGQTAATTKSVNVTCALPSISAQPASRAITSGQSTTVTVTASAATSYQWYQGAAPSTTTPVGTNSGALTVTPWMTTSYWVKVTNGCGSTSSNTATVTVCTAPAITTQPASQTISSGTPATLSVAVSGTGPFTYQWFEGASGTTTVPVGTNNTSFTTPALTATKSYWVRVTSACNGGIVSSNTATVTVSAIQIARRQKAAAVANSQTSITATWTQSTQAGSLLVAVVSASNGSWPIANVTPPAGWLQAVTSEWSNVKTTIYYYPNNPGGRTAETFTTGNFNFRDQTVQLAEYTGVMTASPLDRVATVGNDTNAGSIFIGSTPVTAQPRELVITGVTTYIPTSFSTPSDSFVELHDHAIGNRLSTAMHERIVNAAGAYGHSITVDTPGYQWTGVVATFRAVN